MKSSAWSQYRRLLAYARPYKRDIAAQFALMGVAVAVGLVKPWPLKVLVDNVVGGRALAWGSWRPAVGPELLLALTCLAFLLIHAGESLVQFGSTSLSTYRSSKMMRDLRSDLMRRLQALSLGFHDSHKVGDLVHRVAFNTTAVETAFQTGFMGTVKSSMTLVGIFIVMLHVNARLTAVALAVVPLLVLCIRRYARGIQEVSREHQTQEGAVSSKAQEILSSIRLVLTFRREAWEQKRFEEACERSVRTRMRTTFANNGFSLGVALILALGTALLFWVGIRQVQAGRLTIGEFLVFNAYLGMLYAPLSVLSYTASAVQSVLGGASRLFEILDTEVEIQDRPEARPLAAVPQDVRFEAVEFGYQEGRSVLHDVSLEVRPGEMIAIVGETGGGKTTLLNLIMRFYDPWRGGVRVGGRDLREVTLESLRRAIALVPQEMALLSDSIRENIAYGRPDADEAAIEQAARLAEADAFIRNLPEGYEARVGERGVRLSAGQRQRIALARAILKDAPILLLDEPTSALDAETETRVMENFERLRDGRTVVLVAHRLSTIRRADRIYLLARGRIVESGTHGELLENDGPYSRLWKAQMEGHHVGALSAV